ncbi:unnamed protein product [Pieris macdunnoughi]|uniref:Uncharacterized protein n=1 Tax=Pieris macdunnoughi TaxID=345717 RepID=A0A821WN59_9NEOP|nr:unnamed protein product [Pieris macdunnoughi]
MSTSTEKGETITVVGCCNAEGNFIPPACIMKWQRKKPEFEDGLPPVRLTPTRAYHARMCQSGIRLSTHSTNNIQNAAGSQT